jgi:hypothetical protein
MTDPNSAFFPSLSNPTPTPTPTPKEPEVKVEELVKVTESEVDSQKRVCEEKQEALTAANEAAVKAHAELIEAQRELARLQAS